MTKSIEEAKAALAAANAAYLSEVERDSERGSRSLAQERRREEHQQSLRDEVKQCERDLEVPHRKAPGGTQSWSEYMAKIVIEIEYDMVAN